MKTIIYLIQVSACTGIFYLFYHLMLRKLTFFTINRWYLLGTLILSFMIPLITIPAGSVPRNSFTEQVSLSSIEQTYLYAPVSNAVKPQTPVPMPEVSFDKMLLFPLFYFLIAGILTIYFLSSLWTIYKGLNGEVIATHGSVKVIKSSSNFRNSSFMNFIFLDDKALSTTELQQVIEHEMVHIEQVHSLDKIFVRLFQIILWFNPFIYAYHKAMDTNHEFEVDQIVSRNSDKEAYANLILRLAASGTDMFGHQFSKFPLSTRISMIFNQPSKGIKKLIYMLIAPLVMISALVFANRDLKNTPQKTLLLSNKNIEGHDVLTIAAAASNNSKPVENAIQNKPENTTSSKEGPLVFSSEADAIAQSSRVVVVRSADNPIIKGLDGREIRTFAADTTLVRKSAEMQKYIVDTKALVKDGKYKEALDRYVWFYDHALESAPSMSGVRNSFLLSDWKSLAAVYPAAMTALTEQRDSKSKQVFDDEINALSAFQDAAALNRTLGENSKTIDLFQKVEKSRPSDAKRYWIFAKTLLFSEKRYDIIRNYVGNPVLEFSVVKERYNQMTALSKDPRMASAGATINSFNANNFVDQTLQLIQFALYNKDVKSAKEIRDEALTVIDDYRLRNAI